MKSIIVRILVVTVMTILPKVLPSTSTGVSRRGIVVTVATMAALLIKVPFQVLRQVRVQLFPDLFLFLGPTVALLLTLHIRKD
jgi:hypothetical protein